MRLLSSFPFAFVASVAFGTAYFFVVFGLLAHLRQPAATPAFPVLLLLWLSPGLLCAGAFAAASRPLVASRIWLWVEIAVLGFVVPFISLNLWALLGTMFLGLTGGAL